MNDADAAKATAKIKGRESNPIWPETAMAMGVMIIAVAAFDETSVRIMVIT